jgi:hypothetical protein
MVHAKRLELALERLQPSDWARFEQFASAFLASEFPSLRTVASPSGDEGRDAELFSPEGEPDVVLQYSVTAYWDRKIRATAKRVREKWASAKQLIYVTNQPLGAEADALKRELRKDYSLALDVRAKSYFVERFEGDAHREAVAEALARDIVDPYLASKEVIQAKAQALTQGESRAAHLFLELQWEDDTRDKGLTKTAFDGLVRMCLRSTTNENRLPRKAIHEQTCRILEGRDQDFVVREVDKALSRLTKHYIRHHTTEDEFCLTFEESQRIKGRLAETEIQDRKLIDEIRGFVSSVFSDEQVSDPAALDALSIACRFGVERFLLHRGELFVSALERGAMKSLGYDTVPQIAVEEVQNRKLGVESERLEAAIVRALTSSGPGVEKYLRDIADTYTLLAFLRETPDVQQAVKKMFSAGEIWLDTSIVLPLLAEEVVDKENWQFRRLVEIARSAGLRFKVAHGVIEEVERHINRSLACVNTPSGEWRGSYPYLYAFYVSTGAETTKFSSWLNIFCGQERPEEDISDYLETFFGVVTADISDDAGRADPELRAAVKEAWVRIHTERRNNNYFGGEFDPHLVLRLAEHDTDNYVGVVVRRHQEGSSVFGFSSWWLTLDHMAFAIQRQIEPVISGKVPPSPVMSADFLTNYLAFGPLRDRVGGAKTAGLPVSIDPSAVQGLTPELVELARTVRKEAEGLPEHVIRRRVRDALDAARRRTGQVTARGLRIASVAGAANQGRGLA